jgi:hypothetical protein
MSNVEHAFWHTDGHFVYQVPVGIACQLSPEATDWKAMGGLKTGPLMPRWVIGKNYLGKVKRKFTPMGTETSKRQSIGTYL